MGSATQPVGSENELVASHLAVQRSSELLRGECSRSRLAGPLRPAVAKSMWHTCRPGTGRIRPALPRGRASAGRTGARPRSTPGESGGVRTRLARYWRAPAERAGGHGIHSRHAHARYLAESGHRTAGTTCRQRLCENGPAAPGEHQQQPRVAHRAAQRAQHPGGAAGSGE